MKPIERNSRVALITAAVLMSGSALAETFSMEGHSENMTSNEYRAVGDGMVVHVDNSGTLMMDDESNPLHGATGDCSGSVAIMGATPEGSGLCTYTVASGDTAVVRWTTTEINADGGNVGTWELVGGSGDWASASASGTFSDTPDAEGKTSINRVTGELNL